MTLLEELAQERTRVTTPLNRATERIAKEMANEILRDPKFRAKMQEMIRALVTVRKPSRRKRIKKS
jgi:hypothetical protein